MYNLMKIHNLVKIPVDVGKILPRSERHRVHGGRRGPRQDRGQQERASQPPGPTSTGRNPHTSPWQQERSSRWVE